MPAAYAHARLGQLVLTDLPDDHRALLERWKSFYTIGLQGPDILLYYRALKKNPVNSMGDSLHDLSGRAFFTRVKAAVLESTNRSAAQAYAYGLICHFTLDALTHGWIAQAIAETGVSHAEIESELERELMREDGLDFRTTSPVKNMKASRDTAQVLASFYPGITPRQIGEAVRSMVVQSKLLLARSQVKRELIYAVLRFTGNYESLQGLVIRPKGNPRCVQTTAALRKLCQTACGRAAALIREFDGCLRGGRLTDPLFDVDFNGIIHAKNERS